MVLFRTPAGLADGLALKELARLPRKVRPETGSPAPRLRIRRGGKATFRAGGVNLPCVISVTSASSRALRRREQRRPERLQRDRRPRPPRASRAEVQLVLCGRGRAERTGAGQLALQLPGIVFPLSFIAIGVALVRARTQPRWCGIVLTLAAALFPVSRIGDVEVLAIAVDVLFLVALVPLGWAILHGRDPVAGSGRRSASLSVAS